MTSKIISVANDFSRYPAGRVLADGPFSGEKFREEILVSVLDAGVPVIIDLDGTRGYGSSFLEEAFGGLIRKGYTKDQIFNCIELRSKDESLIKEIHEYIEQGTHE